MLETKNKTMEGINFVTDENDNKIAVQIDLNKYGEMWEDFFDVIVAESRKDDEEVSWEELKKELKKEGKL